MDMENEYRVLIVDDDRAQAEMLGEFLRISGYKDTDWAENINSVWRLLGEQNYDIVLLDYKLPDGTGLDVLAEMQKRGHRIPVVMVTGQGNERIAVQAIQHGAADYLLKSGDFLITLPSLIQKTIQAHQLQLAVERSLEQIRYQATLLNNVNDAIVVWDLDGEITYWNAAASVLFGWSEKERVGHPVAQIYLSTFRPKIKQPRADETISRPVVRQCKNRDGHTVWVSSNVTALCDFESDNRVIGYMDICHDITERVEIEQALRESEERYRAIVEDYQTELICRFKPDGRFTFVNEVYCRYFGRTRAELLGMNLMDLLPEDEQRKLKNHLSSFGADLSVLTIEHQVIVPNQGLRWLQHTDRAIYDDQGNIREFQSVGRDITNRKELEAQIQTAQANLIQAARMATIGEMASGVAHQIYNPLTTIIADAQILLRKMPSAQTGRDSAEAIEQAGWRLQQVVQRLMEFSRPQSDALTSVSINETIRRALSLVGAHIEAVGCRLKVHLSADIPTVQGNPRQLEDLWVNLLLMARDASANGRGHNIHVNSKPGLSNQVIVEVCDDGDRIHPDKLESIFEPNFIDGASGRGTGLELSICREIVRQHRGRITAESAPDRDTIFRVTLPAETPPLGNR